MRSAVTPLQKLILERIRRGGPITFADYMQACLYDPDYGYYSQGAERHRADYYTSVEMSPIFGRLIARQLREMWAMLGQPRRFDVVECGAGSGKLARQILDFSRDALPEYYAAIRYHAVEISPNRRKSAVAALTSHVRDGRAAVVAELPQTIADGCVLSNEFFDALPVHRVVMSADGLREIFVDVEGDQLREQTRPVSTPEIGEYFQRQQIKLREGQITDVGLDACRWIQEIGRELERGFVLTVDYGREARELYDEHHMRGTTLAYCNHRATEDFYLAPGEQDLTAHVNFTALDLWGRKAGLVRTGLTSQSNFLVSVAKQSNFADLAHGDENELSQLRSRLQFKSLVYPEGMGEAFQVMVQQKGIAAPELTGLKPL